MPNAAALKLNVSTTDGERAVDPQLSGYYEWLTHPISNRAQADARLLRLVRASFMAGQGVYGAPRIFLDLREAGETCSKHRVARLMRVNQLRALPSYRIRRWSVGKPAVLITNLLQRQFTVTRRNQAWVTDITPIRAWPGWLYLAVVMDLFSRKIIGWSAGPTIYRDLVLDAVLMAVRRRRPRFLLVLPIGPPTRVAPTGRFPYVGVGPTRRPRTGRGRRAVWLGRPISQPQVKALFQTSTAGGTSVLNGLLSSPRDQQQCFSTPSPPCLARRGRRSRLAVSSAA